MPTILSFLQNLGLTETEVTLYELLLKLGQAQARDIIEASSLKRPTVYKALYSLEKKGLVSSKDVNKKIHFTPSPPTELLRQTDERYAQISHVKDSLEALLPQLSAEYIHSIERPIVREYEGVDGLKDVFNDIYAPKSEPIYGCVDLEKADEAVPSYVVDKLIPLRIKNNVHALTFLASSVQAEEVKKKDDVSFRESVLLNKLKYPLPAEIDIYEDKVAMLSFEQGEFVGIVIENEAIATSLKSIFKFAFEKSREENDVTQQSSEVLPSDQGGQQ